MNNLTTIKGVVEGFERSTHVTGTDHRTSTTHLSIFKIGTNRIMLRTSAPSIISDGDEVVVAGIHDNGQFSALACKNLTANWVSPLKQQGCALTALLFMAFISFLMSFMIIPIFFCGVCIYFAYRVKKHDKSLKLAYDLIKNV